MTRRGLAELLAIVAPPSCLSCREPLVIAGALLCGGCLRALPWLRGDRCARCALPVHGPRGCPARHAGFARAWAPMAYEGPARALVHALKYRGSRPAAELMAAQLAATLPAAMRAVHVVPVPPHSGRRRTRGFDPAGRLAGALGARLERAPTTVLARHDRAAPQARSGRRARLDPHRLRVSARASIAGTVLLVDDVHTTGATLDACARALRAAGAERVLALTYARTL